MNFEIFDIPALTQRMTRLLLMLAVILFPAALWAGECLISDSDLLTEQKEHYESIKASGLGIEGVGWELRCWRGDEGLDDELQSVLLEMMSDSSIHPFYVAAAANDYIFFDRDARLEALPTVQGPARYALIRPLLENSQKAPTAVPPIPLGEGEFDYIDGPAHIRSAPKGEKIATLPDNTKVRIYQEQNGWLEIHSGKVRGWTYRTNLMGHIVGKQPAEAFPVLARAAFMGYMETVDFLLRQGADVNATDRFGRNALHWAVLGSSFKMGGVEREILQKLCIRDGLDINRRDSAGETPLLMAVKHQDLGVIETLLAVPGVDANLADNDGTTPFSYAIRRGKQDIFDALLKATPKIAVNAPNSAGETLLAVAVREAQEFVPQLLTFPDIDIEQADNRGQTPLFTAVANHDSETVRLLLERGARVEVVDHEGKNLLHAYLDCCDEYRLNKGHELFEMLVKDPRVEADRPDAQGIPPLYKVIIKGWVDGARMLLTRSDVNVNRRFKNGGYDVDDSYLRFTLNYLGLKNTREIALLLLDREDIDVNAEITRDHMTPIFFPNDMWHGKKYSQAIAEKILAHKPNLEMENESGETPLIYNIKKEEIEVVEFLLKAGADINHSRNGDKGGTYWGESLTPLMYAEKYRKTAIVELLKQAAAQDHPLPDDNEVTPEGIPLKLLKNPSANEAIRNYRGYLVDTTTMTIEKLDAEQVEEAVKRLEFILAEIAMEVGGSMPEFSGEQRGQVKKTFSAIQSYYQEHPRAESAWLQNPANQQNFKDYFLGAESKVNEVMSGMYDTLPNGDMQNHAPLMPILIMRDYMARNAIEALTLISHEKTDEAKKMLREVVQKSQVN